MQIDAEENDNLPNIRERQRRYADLGRYAYAVRELSNIRFEYLDVPVVSVAIALLRLNKYKCFAGLLQKLLDKKIITSKQFTDVFLNLYKLGIPIDMALKQVGISQFNRLRIKIMIALKKFRLKLSNLGKNIGLYIRKNRISRYFRIRHLLSQLEEYKRLVDNEISIIMLKMSRYDTFRSIMYNINFILEELECCGKKVGADLFIEKFRKNNL